MGAICDGTFVRGRDGSSWAAVNDLMRLVACPAGWIIVRDNSSCQGSIPGQLCLNGPEQDQCFKCPGTPYPGFYSIPPASFPGS